MSYNPMLMITLKPINAKYMSLLNRYYKADRAAVDLVDDGPVEVATTQEISVERMYLTTRIDRRVGCGERLAEHLPAEDLWAADISALAAEQIDLQPLELKLAQQIQI